jgi:hypothetical protein
MRPTSREKKGTTGNKKACGPNFDFLNGLLEIIGDGLLYSS